MTKWKQNFRNVCKFIKKKKLKYHIYISIQTLCNNTWNLAQVPPISLDHCWDASTPWLESPCGKFNWLDMNWKGTHLSVYHSWQCISERKPSHEVKGTACRAQTQECIEAQICGRLQKKFCCTEGSQEHSGFHNSQMEEVWHNRDSSKSWFPAKLSNWWRGALSRLVTKNLMVTLFELHDHICRWEKPTEGQTSLQHSTDLGFMAVWPNSIPSSVKTHENTLGICKKST